MNTGISIPCFTRCSAVHFLPKLTGRGVASRAEGDADLVLRLRFAPYIMRLTYRSYSVPGYIRWLKAIPPNHPNGSFTTLRLWAHHHRSL